MYKANLALYNLQGLICNLASNKSFQRDKPLPHGYVIYVKSKKSIRYF